jgi:hypothetical protein
MRLATIPEKVLNRSRAECSGPRVSQKPRAAKSSSRNAARRSTWVRAGWHSNGFTSQSAAKIHVTWDTRFADRRLKLKTHVKIVLMDRDWHKYFMAFVAYFDASGGQSLVGKVVAGYVGRVEQWEKFDFDWRMVLAHDNVPNFHMQEFAHFKGPFEGWKGQDTRRANFLSRLVGVAKDHLSRRITTIVLNEDYREVDQEYALTEVVEGPYALAARTCAGKVRRWMSENGYSEPVKFAFEDGDTDVNIGRLKERFKRDGLSIPEFQPKKDDQGNWFTPFQAADFAAYEFLKASDWADRGLIHSMRDLRKSLLNLSTIPADDGTYVKSDLIALCEKANIPKRNVVII